MQFCIFLKHVYKYVPDVYEKYILCEKKYLLTLKHVQWAFKIIDHLLKKSAQNMYVRKIYIMCLKFFSIYLKDVSYLHQKYT